MKNDPCKILPQNICHNVLPDGNRTHIDASALTSDAQADSGADSVTVADAALFKHAPGNSRARPGKPKASRSAPGFLVTLRSLVGADVNDAKHGHSLARFAACYLHEEVRGIQSPNTFEAKSRDLVGFVTWFVRFNGHGHIEHWLPRDTQAYLNKLEHTDGKAATTVNRAFATLRRFAKWCHEQPGHVFEKGGMPTRGIRGLDVDEADCKKLTRQEIHQLFKAADALVRTEERQNATPRRNRAMLAVLYYTGLRVSELVALKREQYQGNYLLNVARKGKSRSKGLYMVAECRKLLDRYLETERRRDDPEGCALPLFLPTHKGRFMTRQLVYHVLRHIAQEASKHQKAVIDIHPHRLRHEV